MRFIIYFLFCIELAVGCGPLNRRCRMKDKNVDKCIIRQIEAERSLLQSVPIELQDLYAETTLAGYNMNINLTNLVVHQTSNFSIHRLDVDLHEKRNFSGDMAVLFPQLVITADYQIIGKWGYITFTNTKGKLKGTLNNVRVRFRSSASVYVKNGMMEYLNMTTAKIKVTIPDGQLALDQNESFGLGGTVTKYAQNNPNEVLGKLTPAIRISVVKYYKKHVHQLLASIPLKYMLTD